MKYLKDPLKAGVYRSQFRLDYSKLDSVFMYLLDLAVKKRVPLTQSKELSDFAEGIRERMSLYPEMKEYELDEAYLVECLEKVTEWLIRLGECPKEIATYAIGYETDEEISKEAIEFFLISRIPPFGIDPRELRGSVQYKGGLFEHRIFQDIYDIILIDTDANRRTETLSFDTITIKGKVSNNRFHNFLGSIPKIGVKTVEIKNRKTFSSRYVFQPYPLAVRLWLGSEKSKFAPKDIRNFLEASINYYYLREWRTSIVLSSIAVEVILADLYEEHFKEYAPSKPIGDIYRQLKGGIDFPESIQKAIEITNNARISAVHRSRFPVSERESTNALYGATNFIMWYSSNY